VDAPKNDHRRSNEVGRRNKAKQAMKAIKTITKYSRPEIDLIKFSDELKEPEAGPTIWRAIFERTIFAARKEQPNIDRSS